MVDIFMDLITLIGKLENSNLTRTINNITGLNGFGDGDNVCWVNRTGGAVPVEINDDSYSDVWKMIVASNFEGVLCLLVLRSLNGRVVVDVFDDVSSLVFG